MDDDHQGRMDGWVEGWRAGCEPQADNGERASSGIPATPAPVCSCGVCCSQHSGLHLIHFPLKSLCVCVSSAGVSFLVRSSRSDTKRICCIRQTLEGSSSSLQQNRNGLHRILLAFQLWAGGGGSFLSFCLLVTTIDHHCGNGGGGRLDGVWLRPEARNVPSGRRHFLLLRSQNPGGRVLSEKR